MFIKTVKSVLNDNWPILIIFMVTVISLRFFYLQNHREKGSFYKEFLTVISMVYIFLLFSLLTKVELNNGSGYNLVPFNEIFRYEFGSKLFVFNVLGNIGAFVIFGVIVASYIKPKSFVHPVIISMIVSTTVEFVQLNIGRSFDVDDIILNVIGGILGYLIYLGIKAIKKHLPSFIKREGFWNTVCIIAFILLLFYGLRVMGVISIK